MKKLISFQYIHACQTSPLPKMQSRILPLNTKWIRYAIKFKYFFVFQHFPLYRKNERACLGLPDGPSRKIASIRNRESWDVLSEESTKFLLEKVEPCLVISGHTHHGCFIDHHSIYELSVPSFSWRNINNPSITLVSSFISSSQIM